MAQRRMFSKSITNSSSFLMMSQSAQNLYFHFGMNADDDGFCEHFTVMRMTESKPDDLKVLQARGFVKIFDDQVLVILDWKENNYIQKDRYTPSKYLEIYKKELKLLVDNIKDTECIQNVNTGKVRLGKVRLGNNNNTNSIAEMNSAEEKDIVSVINSFKEINPTINFGNKTQRGAAADLIKQFGLEKTLNTIAYYKTIKDEKFSPVITTPYQLKEKMGQLIAFYNKNNSSKFTTI
jgi:hypothetical protein